MASPEASALTTPFASQTRVRDGWKVSWVDIESDAQSAPAYVARRGQPRRPEDLEDRAHRCLEFRDPETRKPFPWEFHRKRKRLAVKTAGRLIVNDGGTMHAACVAGYGIAQVMAVATEPLLASGQLVELFPDWPDERFPLYALYPSRQHPSAKVRAFLDFVIDITAG